MKLLKNLIATAIVTTGVLSNSAFGMQRATTTQPTTTESYFSTTDTMLGTGALLGLFNGSEKWTQTAVFGTILAAKKSLPAVINGANSLIQSYRARDIFTYINNGDHGSVDNLIKRSDSDLYLYATDFVYNEMPLIYAIRALVKATDATKIANLTTICKALADKTDATKVWLSGFMQNEVDKARKAQANAQAALGSNSATIKNDLVMAINLLKNSQNDGRKDTLTEIAKKVDGKKTQSRSGFWHTCSWMINGWHWLMRSNLQ